MLTTLTRPPRTPPDLAATRAYFDAEAPGWDQKDHADAATLEAILTLGRVGQGGRVLDVACGTGILFPHLLAREPELLRAIDLSPAMAAIAAQKHADPRLSVGAADFYTFGEAGFDTLVVYNAYPHFLDKARFARAAHACLRPGGRLLIAHGRGRGQINACHQRGAPRRRVSASLQSCAAEAARLADHFAFDTMVDSWEMYILSGTVRP